MTNEFGPDMEKGREARYTLNRNRRSEFISATKFNENPKDKDTTFDYYEGREKDESL